MAIRQIFGVGFGFLQKCVKKKNGLVHGFQILGFLVDCGF